jgi:hypothetical protein
MELECKETIAFPEDYVDLSVILQSIDDLITVYGSAYIKEIGVVYETFLRRCKGERIAYLLGPAPFLLDLADLFDEIVVKYRRNVVENIDHRVKLIEIWLKISRFRYYYQ